MLKRSSGVLMHISSLPGKFGIGTFGKEAYRFVDFLEETKQSYWQILPLTTTGYGDSPYQSFSAIAGNINFIDFDMLREEKLLLEEDYQNVFYGENREKVNYCAVYESRKLVLAKAVLHFQESEKWMAALEEFQRENRFWLEDFSEYMAIKSYFSNQALQDWKDEKIRKREKASLEKYRMVLKEEILYHSISQFLFFYQWHKLKDYANKKGIQIIGDMPIYVSRDSVEMWTMPDLFKLDKSGKALYVAGCPADDFSPDGQLWGNPIYNWKVHQEKKYSWWVYRIQESLKIYDVIRIDHFKGFSDYWQISGDAAVAKEGSWEPGPGLELFDTIKKELGDVPIIAENLGFIDEKAKKLLEDCGFPGMKVLQFAFEGGAENQDLPYHYIQNSVAYTGTHDNPLVSSWFEEQTEEVKRYVCQFLNIREGESISQAMIRGIFSSVSILAVVTMQDLLEKGKEARMNIPAIVGGNWEWRMKMEDLSEERK
ncbi:MAG TPA: 4-alpha-glucanotransferase, partial [Fusobacterium sp.]|uniref:4-alpha-glucanotransferase n=1 Tax=Fusobacterium sp. TaxID=68766 RepID=UPI002F416668